MAVDTNPNNSEDGVKITSNGITIKTKAVAALGGLSNKHLRLDVGSNDDSSAITLIGRLDQEHASLTSKKLTIDEAAIGRVEIKSNKTATNAIKYFVFNYGSSTVLVD